MSGKAGQCARRRDLLRSLVRYPLLAALGLAGWRLGRRPPAAGPIQAGQACINRCVCRTCRRLSTCGLPHALMARTSRSHDRTKPYERTFE